MAKPKPGAQQISLEQVEAMIAKLTSEDWKERDESLDFRRKKYSKRARLEALEREVEYLRREVEMFMLEKLIALREDLLKGHATKEAMDLVSRLTTFKKGEG